MKASWKSWAFAFLAAMLPAPLVRAADSPMALPLALVRAAAPRARPVPVPAWLVARLMLARWPVPWPCLLRPAPPLSLLAVACARTLLSEAWTLLWVAAFFAAALLWAAATADWTL